MFNAQSNASFRGHRFLFTGISLIAHKISSKLNLKISTLLLIIHGLSMCQVSLFIFLWYNLFKCRPFYASCLDSNEKDRYQKLGTGYTIATTFARKPIRWSINNLLNWDAVSNVVNNRFEWIWLMEYLLDGPNNILPTHLLLLLLYHSI